MSEQPLSSEPQIHEVPGDRDMVMVDANRVIQDDIACIAQAPLPWEQLRGRAILVTGGDGFLASYLVKSLLMASSLHDLDLRVICVMRRPLGPGSRLLSCLHLPNLQFFQHDISQGLPPDFPVADYIIHSASQASPKYFGIDPVGTLKANSVGTMNLLEFAVAHSVRKFMFFSSGEVYGSPNNSTASVSETEFGYLDPFTVRASYAESKRMGETLCAAWSHQYGLHTNVVRPFHTYGPGLLLDDGRVFADFIAAVVSGRDIVLKSDGSAQRPFCYIADATVGFLTVLLTGEPAQAYNVANPDCEISMLELARLVAGLFPERGIGVRFEKRPEDGAYLASPVKRCPPSIGKIRQLGWSPQTGIESGFRRTIESYL